MRAKELAGIDKPEISNDMLWLPKDWTHFEASESIIATVKLGNQSKYRILVKVYEEWIFYVNGRECPWDNLRDDEQSIIVSTVISNGGLYPDDNIPWTETQYAMAVLETL